MGFLQTTLERAMVVNNTFPNFYVVGMSQEGPWFLAAIWNLIYDFRAQKIVSYLHTNTILIFNIYTPNSCTYLKGAAFSNALFVGSNRIPFSECFEILTWSIPSPSNLRAPFYILQISHNLSPKWCLMDFCHHKTGTYFFPTWNAWTHFFVKNACLHPFLFVRIHRQCLLYQCHVFWNKQDQNNIFRL